mmetsp:Transcript_8941/g.21832  ORF Transcript_8941/g.21832 Transcript_8941/m.21832 type:complete len:389 (+) Transcript_8941:38-1204(+)
MSTTASHRDERHEEQQLQLSQQQEEEERRELSSLPKAELHLHLEGAMRRTTLVELCERHGIQVPMDTAGKRFSDFSAFRDTYVAACECLREPADIRRLVLEVARDAKASGATWIEAALSFTYYWDRFGGPLQTLKLLAESAEEAELETGVGIGLIVSIERDRGPAEAENLANVVQKAFSELSIRGRPAVVGFGLHGTEEGNPPTEFLKAFEIARSGRRRGSGTDTENTFRVASVPHAGEIAPSRGMGPQSVIDSVTLLRADRIGHGVLAYGNDKAMRLLADSGVCLDVCPSSNYFLNVVPTIEDHPLTKLLNCGISCTINSDDPLLFGCSLLEEFELCRKSLQMDDTMLAQCAKHSFQHSCAPEDIKTKNLAEIDQWLSKEATAQTVG